MKLSNINFLNKPSNKIDKSIKHIIINRTLLVFLPVFLLMIFGSIVVINIQEKLESKMFRSLETHIVDIRQENVQTSLFNIINDLMLLSISSQFEMFLNDITNTESFEKLSEDFRELSLFRGVYDQVRFMDTSGMEIIRVNFNDGNPIIIPQEKLQNKKDRYYFTKALKLNKGEFYISPLDLNVEKGIIEQPLKPMIRIATPVFDQKGNKKGIILLNYFGQNIIDQFINQENPFIESRVMLLNSDGYWLKGPSSEYEWGFMYQDRKDLSFANAYIDAWDRVRREESSQFETEKGLFTFKTIYPINKEYKSDTVKIKTSQSHKVQLKTSEYHWKILSHIPAKILYEKRDKRRHLNALFLALLSGCVWFISWRLAKVKYLKIKAQQGLKESEASLKESNKTKDKFFSIISHDLKSPINSLLGLSDLLLKHYSTYDDKMRKEFIKLINDSTKRTLYLLEDLLTWSRSQSGNIEFSIRKIKIKTLINEIVLLSQPIAQNKSIILLDKTETDISVYADKNMISTVLRNLITNAIKFTNKNGVVTVTVKNAKNQEFVEISVSDTGIGIPEDIIHDLFLLNKNKSTPGTGKESGTGLGLILCKEFVEKQGGKIWVSSEFGKGSEFVFTSPIVLGKALA